MVARRLVTAYPTLQIVVAFVFGTVVNYYICGRVRRLLKVIRAIAVRVAGIQSEIGQTS